MATALIKITQGATTDIAGRSVVGTAGGGDIVVTNGDNTGVTSWVITLLSVPIGSATSPGIKGSDSTNTPSATIPLDGTPGCYRIQLDVSDGSTVDTDIRNFAIAAPNGAILAPYQADPLPLETKPDELNFGGQTQGWMGNSTYKMVNWAVNAVPLPPSATPSAVGTTSTGSGVRYALDNHSHGYPAFSPFGVLANSSSGSSTPTVVSASTASTIFKRNAANSLVFDKVEYDDLSDDVATLFVDASAPISATRLDENAAAYNTMAQLRAVAPVADRVRKTNCHTTLGDGGGGTWTGVTGASPGTYVHNGGTIIVPSGGNGSAAWVRNSYGAVNLKWFGAVGDYTTDDTTAVHAAFDWCHSNGHMLYVPRGNYRVTSGWTTSVSYGALNVVGELGDYGGYPTSKCSRFVLDSTDPASFFVDQKHLGKYTFRKLAFECATGTYVLDRNFFKHTFNTGSVVYGWSLYEDLFFNRVEKPFVFKTGMYSQSTSFRNLFFANSGTIHSEGDTLKVTGLRLDNIYHSGSVPVNSEKCVMDLRGCRMIDGGLVILEGSLPESAHIEATMVATGTTPPVVTLTGTLTQTWLAVNVRITNASNPAAVAWEYEVVTQNVPIATVTGTPFDSSVGTSVANMSASGIGVALPAGTYNSDNSWASINDGWTVFQYSDSYPSYVRENLGTVQALWSEWGNTPLYVLKGKNKINITLGGSTIQRGAKVRVEDRGSFIWKNLSMDSKLIGELFDLEDMLCNVTLEGLTTRDTTGITRLPTSTRPADAKIHLKDVVMQRVDIPATVASGATMTSFDGSSTIWEFDGGFPDGQLATWQGIDGTPTPYPSTHATHGRMIVIEPSTTPGNTRGRFRFPIRNCQPGYQYNINIKGKAATFTGGAGALMAIQAIQDSVNVAETMSYALSGEEFELSIPISVLESTDTYIGFDVAAYLASGWTGNVEIYALSVTMGNTVAKRKYPRYSRNVSTFSSAAPTKGGWTQGDFVRNTAPTTTGIEGWVCTVTGSPGTWVEQGAYARALSGEDTKATTFGLLYNSFTPSKLGTLLTWFVGDNETSVIDFSTTPDVFTSIPDKVSGTFSNTGANRPQVDNNASGPWVAPKFVASTRLVSSRAASTFGFLHKTGTAWTLSARIRVDTIPGGAGVICSTYDGVGTNVGLNLQVMPTGILQVGVGRGTTNLTATSAAGVISAGVTYVVTLTKTAADLLTVYVGETSVASVQLTALSAADPSNTLAIGALASSNTSAFLGAIAEVVIVQGTPSAPNVRVLKSYLEAEWPDTAETGLETVKVYNTAAEAKAAVEGFAIGRTVRTLGCTTKGDDGGGDWECVAIGSLVDNLGTVLTGSTKALIRKNYNRVRPEWFGAKRDGNDDSTAFTAAIATGRDLELSPGYYGFASEVTVTTNIYGSGKMGVLEGGTTLQALTAAMRSILHVTQTVKLDGFYVNGLSTSLYGIHLQGASVSNISNIRVEGARLDGVKYAPSGNNNAVEFTGCLIRNNGTSYNTGTATCAANTNVVTFTGAPDLTTLGIRTGQDYILLAQDETADLAYWASTGHDMDRPVAYEVLSVTTNTITVYPAMRHNNTASAYLIGSGSGINAVESADNGSAILNAVTLQTNAVAGFQEMALYGSTMNGCVIELNGFYGHIVGRRDFPNQVAVLGQQEIGTYYEGHRCTDILYAFTAGDITFIPGKGEKRVRTFGGAQTAFIAGVRPIFPDGYTTSRAGFELGIKGTDIFAGSGSPEGVVAARMASEYRRRDTGDVFRKTTGSGDTKPNTGWVIEGVQTFAVAGAPAASGVYSGALAYVSDGDAGRPCVARSNGTNWVVIDTGRTISSSVSDGVLAVPTAASYLATHSANYGRRHTTLTDVTELQLPTVAEDASWKEGDVVTFLVLAGTTTIRAANAKNANSYTTSVAPPIGGASVIVATKIAGDNWIFSGDLA